MSPDAPRHTSVMSADAEALAGIYAQGLLDHLVDESRAETAADELDALPPVLDGVKGAVELFAMPSSARQRCELVDRIFSGRVSEPVHALLSVMARRGRLGLLRAVGGAFRKMLEARQGWIDVTVTTALKLTDEQCERLAGRLARTFSAKAVVTARVDANILGGAVIQVGDSVYDASLTSDLAKFDRQLTDRVAAAGGRAGRNPEPSTK